VFASLAGCALGSSALTEILNYSGPPHLVSAVINRLSAGGTKNIDSPGEGSLGPVLRSCASSTKRNGAFRLTTGMKAAAGQTSSVPA